MEHLRKPLSNMAMKLFLAAKELHPDENVVICPFTVTSIITMLYYASEGSPAVRQMEAILKYESLFDGRADPRAVLLAFREATRILTKVPKNQNAGDDEVGIAQDFRVIIANRVFLQRNCNIHPEFLEVVQKNLKIEFEHLNFSDDAEVTQIEQWLKDKIRSRFNVSLPQEMIDAQYHGPRMVIASAAHFRAGWEVPFDKRNTKKAPFYTSNGKFKQVEMMNLTEKFPFFEDEKKGIRTLELPYFRNDASIVLSVPMKRGGLNEMIKGMNPEFLVEMHMRKRMKNVKISLPKFRFHSTYDIKKLLNQVGIRDVFEKDVVLSRMTSESVFKISEGVHKCAMQVDEDGTFATEEASAATDHNVSKDSAVSTPPTSLTGKIGTEKSSLPPGTEEFTADGPFLMAIRHNRTGVYLFSGCVMLP